MEELELVFEVLEGGPDGVEALGFADGGVIVIVVVIGDGERSKVLDENETGGAVIGSGDGGVGKVRWRVVFEDFDGSEKVGSGDGVNGVAELVVEVPNFLHNRFDFLHLHIPFHFLLLLFGGEWTQRNTAQHTAQAVTQYNSKTDLNNSHIFNVPPLPRKEFSILWPKDTSFMRLAVLLSFLKMKSFFLERNSNSNTKY